MQYRPPDANLERCYQTVSLVISETYFGKMYRMLSIFSEQYNICCPVKTIRAQVARRDKP